MDPNQLEMEIDNKVFEWIENQQTKFKAHEKDKIILFNLKVIAFLESLRPTGFPSPIFMMQQEIISSKIRLFRQMNIKLEESL